MAGVVFLFASGMPRKFLAALVLKYQLVAFMGVGMSIWRGSMRIAQIAGWQDAKHESAERKVMRMVKPPKMIFGCASFSFCTRPVFGQPLAR